MQFFPKISIDLTLSGTQTFRVTPANRLWICEKLLVGNALVANDPLAIIAVKFSEDTSEEIAMGTNTTLVNSVGGEFDRVIVRVISPGNNTRLLLNVGRDITMGFSNADNSSPYVSGGGSVMPPALFS